MGAISGTPPISVSLVLPTVVELRTSRTQGKRICSGFSQDVMITTEGVDGVFNDDDADNIIAIVRSFNDTVGVIFESA